MTSNLQEFEVTLTKIQGSLGFTLRKEDDSALGHYVRALVREPALTDGRIRPGDKIIAVSLLKCTWKCTLTKFVVKIWIIHIYVLS